MRPEYVIIRKLESFREGRGDKHLRDIRFMLAATNVERIVIERTVAERRLQIG